MKIALSALIRYTESYLILFMNVACTTILSLVVFSCNPTILLGQNSMPFWEQRLTPQDENAKNSALIRVFADIENVPRLFIFDTGANHLLDMSLLSDQMRFLRDKQMGTPSGEVRLSIYAGPTVQVGKQDFVLNEIGLIDLTAISRAVGDEVAGVLGISLVMDHGLGYDGKGGYFYMGRTSVRIFDDTYQLELGDSGLCTYDVELQPGRLKCVIDTGMNTPMSVKPVIFDELKSRGLITQWKDVRSQTLAGEKVSRFGIINSVTIWGTRLENVPCLESSNNAIGLDLLKRFNFFINGTEETIELSTHSETHAPFKWDRSGLSIFLSDEEILIDMVKPNSPAEEAKLVTGTRIVAVNDEHVGRTWQELYRLRDLFATQGPMRVSLIVDYEGVQERVELSW
jgi:predicted aspartyl protease